jgi:putative Holliday junction resolvase
MPATPEAADRVLGFDYGERRIGMAFGQRVTGTAQALAVVGNGAAGPAWQLIDQALRDALVVGLPLTLDGNEQPIARSARRFAGALAARYGLPVHHHDERLTSVEAGARFVAARRSGTRRAKHAAALDAMAAQVIVERFLAATLRPRAGAAS